MNNRNGKIARLSQEIRQELNERLERSEPGPQLLAWLNASKEVKKILKDEFAGIPISKQNLSEWRKNGFQEWLARQDLWAKVRNVENFAGELGEEKDSVLADDVATVLAARYAALISDWDGEVDDKFEAKVRVLNSLCRGLVALQRGMHRAASNYKDLLHELEEEEERTKAYCKKKKLDQIWALRREPMVAKIFGGGEAGRKLAKYVVQVENDVPGAELELPDELEKPVKPAKSARSAKQTRKKALSSVHNNLPSNALHHTPAPKTTPPESSPVKPSQTSLPPANPISPIPPPEPSSEPSQSIT